MEKHINVACPKCSGGPMPRFNSKSINESKFEPKVRFKEYDAYIDGQVGYVKWLAQETGNPSDAWETEIRRAFKANGLKDGSTIHVKFSSRSTRYVHEYDMTV